MIDAVVSLNGEEFEVSVPGDVYDGDLLDFNAAVRSALAAHDLAHPLEPLESAALEVSIRRLHAEVSAHDGEGVSHNRSEAQDRNRRLADGVDRNRDPEVEEGNEHLDSRDPDDFSEAELDELTAPEGESGGESRKDYEDHDGHEHFQAGDDRDVARDFGPDSLDGEDVRDEGGNDELAEDKRRDEAAE